MHAIRERLTELKFHPSLLALRQLRKSVADAYPSLLLRLSRGRRAALLAEFRACTSARDCIEFTRRHMATGSCQIPWEIESAIGLIASARPRIMCEIGTFDGGTSLLFSRFLPTLEVMLCIDLYVRNKQLLRLLAPPRQRLQFFDMPSYGERTVARVAKFLDGRMIDVLFIDGDHRYEGVKQDFLCYRRFVRSGGLILFHDIVEDKGGGRAWVGGVPKLWKELAASYPHREFIHSHGQDGFGIGALTYATTGGRAQAA
jgi:cephalosporin hydroxylase